jgi:hypothetical protein
MNAHLKRLRAACTEATVVPVKGGRPREYDREAFAAEFEAYIEATDIPMVTEFAAEKGLSKQLLRRVILANFPAGPERDRRRNGSRGQCQAGRRRCRR